MKSLVRLKYSNNKYLLANLFLALVCPEIWIAQYSGIFCLKQVLWKLGRGFAAVLNVC